MKSPTGILVIAFSFLLGIVPVRGLAAQTNRPATGRWGCTSLQNSDTIYVTAAWDGTATMQAVEAGFADRLSTQYGYKGHSSCSRANMAGSTLAGIQAEREQQFALWVKSGKKVVQTGWTYGSAVPATSAAAPAAPPASPPAAKPDTSNAAARSGGAAEWAVCRMTVPKKEYLSGVMEPPGSVNPDSLGKAFAGFLGKKYGVAKHSAECGVSASQAEAAVRLKAWRAEAAKHRATNGPTIETGWVYPLHASS